MAFSGSVIIFAMTVLSVNCASISARSTIQYDLHSAIQEWTTWECKFPDTEMYTAQSGQELKHLHLDSKNRELDECGLLNLQESQSWAPKEMFLYKVCEAIFQGSMTLCKSTDENTKNFVNTALTPHALANAAEYTKQKNVCFYASNWPDHIKETFSFMNSRSDCEEFCLNSTEGIKKVCELLVSFACQLANRGGDGYIKCLPSSPNGTDVGDSKTGGMKETNVGDQQIRRKNGTNVGSQQRSGTGGTNIGDQQTGGINAGDQQTVGVNGGDQQTGRGTAADQQTGGANAGDQQTGWVNAGDQQTSGANAGNQQDTVDPGKVESKPGAASSIDETEKLAYKNDEVVQEVHNSYGSANESADSGHILAYFLTAVVLLCHLS